MGYLVLRMKYIECVRPESPKFDGISLVLSIAKKMLIERSDLCRPDPGAGGVEEGGRVDALEHGSLEYLREKIGERQMKQLLSRVTDLC